MIVMNADVDLRACLLDESIRCGAGGRRLLVAELPWPDLALTPGADLINQQTQVLISWIDFALSRLLRSA